MAGQTLSIDEKTFERIDRALNIAIGMAGVHSRESVAGLLALACELSDRWNSETGPWNDAEQRLLASLRMAREDAEGMNGLAQLNWPTLAQASDFYEALRDYQAACAIREEEEAEERAANGQFGAGA